MAEANQDIRITKTQRALVAALLALLEKNSFQRITVGDICREALVSRSTFYAHFEDKYMLLRRCLQELNRVMREETSGLAVHKRLQASLQAIYDHANIYRNIFFDDPNRELISMVRQFFVQLFDELLQRRGMAQRLPDCAPSLVAIYCAGGIAAMVEWWIDGGFHVPVEEMARCLHALQSNLLDASPPDVQAGEGLC